MPTGLTTTTAAEAVIPRLQSLHTLDLAAMNGQRVNAVDGHQQSLVVDLDVVNSQFDPVIHTFLTGVAADLRPIIGTGFTHLTYQLSWVDPLPSATSEVTNPSRIKAGHTSTTTTTTTTPEAKPEKDAKPDQKQQTTPQEVTATLNSVTEPGDTRPGTSLTITKPRLWTWIPRGEVMLQKEHAMILTTEHPAGTAVMIVEAQP